MAIEINLKLQPIPVEILNKMKNIPEQFPKFKYFTIPKTIIISKDNYKVHEEIKEIGEQ